MKPIGLTFSLVLWSFLSFGQNYERKATCGTDTIDVDHYVRYERVRYKGFACTKTTKLGIRFDIAFNTFDYNKRTQRWLGNHNAAQLGIAIAHGNFNIGARAKLASTSPDTVLLYNGQLLGKNDRVNPAKVEYDISYSHHIKYNVCVEPYLALTAHSFHVFRDTVHEYPVRRVKGLTAGVTLTKYFGIKKSKNYEYFALFARYGYGFTDFKKIHSSLGFGYHDISFGIAYKAFGKTRFFRKVNGEVPKKKMKWVKGG
jgi:hypothetical protein